MVQTINEVEWFDDERGCSGYAVNKTGVELVDDITNLNPIQGATVFHTRSLHISARGATVTHLNFYDGAVAAGSIRWSMYCAANTSYNFQGLRSMRFHSTIVINQGTTSSTVFVHIGGVLRNN